MDEVITNMENDKFTVVGTIPEEDYYIYELINPISYKPFYVGKGKGLRCLDHFKSEPGNKNRHKKNTIQKFIKMGKPIPIKIVFTSNKEEEALNYEKNLISLYGRVDNKTGILTNLTDGGEGVSGRTFSPVDRAKISKRVKGPGNPMYGRKRTEDEKRRISITHKANYASGKNIPTKHTEEWKLHLRENNAGGRATSKPVYQICPVSKTIIREWSSARQAGLGVGLKAWRNISPICVKKTTFTAGGFIWRFTTDCEFKHPSASFDSCVHASLEQP